MTRIRTFTIAAMAAALLTTPLLQDTATAQGRRVRPVPARGRVVAGAYYRPLFSTPFFSPLFSPFYDPWFPYGYGWYPPFAYGPGFANTTASLRLQVSPRDTEVFVDGYYAGTVDEFDGMFQRLHLEPGEHDVVLYRDGHRSVTQKIMLQPNKTFRVRHTMESLAAGETPDARPVAPSRPVTPRQREVRPERDGARHATTDFGAIAIRVQPADADVIIDGERWEGPADDEALIVQVSPGPHRIEVRKDGYRGYTSEVEVRQGDTTPVNVSLPRQ